ITRSTRPRRRAQRTSVTGMSAAPAPTSSTVTARSAGRERSRRWTWWRVSQRPPKRPLRRVMASRQLLISAAGAGRSINSMASWSRSRGIRSDASPSEQGALGREARTERDHQAPVAWSGAAGVERLFEDEQHGGRRHVAEVLQHMARVRDLGVVELEETARLLDHASAGGVQYEVTHVLLLEPLRGHEALGHLLHHAGPDAAHLLGELHARPPVANIEAQDGELLLTEQRLLLHYCRLLDVVAHC